MADFIPKSYKKEPVTIRMSFQKLETVDKQAAKYNMSRSEFVNQCIDYAMEHMPSPKK
ncbi:MAG: hypothetical protein FWF49_02585 [Oscillospiraceae bacterium]|nr:hypothetical protein [Oscillospiraceae bacterium]